MTRRARVRKPPRPRRFKVQRRFVVTARDTSNKAFLFGESWPTVSQADHLVTAERQLINFKHDEPRHEFRLVEEWPIGSNERVLK